MFVRDMIIPIKHVADWIFIHQRNQAQIEKDVIHKNSTRIKYDHRVGDKVLLRNKATYKYETPFIGMHDFFNMEKPNSNLESGCGYKEDQ